MLREWIRANRPAAAAAGTVVLTGMVVLGMVLGSVRGPARPSQTPSPNARSSVSPSEPGQAGWTSLELPPYQPVAELIPTEIDGSGISAATQFTLRSHDTTPAVELAAGLRASPAVELAVTAGPSADVAIVRPLSPLIPGAQYAFELLAPDGALLGAWDFRTGGPLHVVTTLPGNETTQVPLDTGIEIVFDQDGVTQLEGHLTINPATPGRLERHGRTWAFVPSANLSPSTLYTVDVTPGVPIDGSDQVLEEGVTFRFETAGEGRSTAPMVFFGAPLREALPGEAPVLPVSVYDPNDDVSRLRPTVDVYELPTAKRAFDAVRILANDLGWATASSSGNVPTDDLARVATTTAAVSADDFAARMSLPVELEAGWFLLDVAQDGRHGQVVLQVTDLAVYALASETRTAVWVNDLRTDRPVPGATVTIQGGVGLGRTDASGLLEVATPAAVIRAQESGALIPVVVTAEDGRRLLAPVGRDLRATRDETRARWWLEFATDRTQYRTDDVIHAWGSIRSRADRAAPGEVELGLVAGWDPAGPPVVRGRATTTARGTFSAELSFAGLPFGQYLVVLYVGGDHVAQAGVEVADIRKPAFRIDVDTERRVYLHGDLVRAQARATFYDGTTAPGMSLRLSADAGGDSIERVVTADRDGTAAIQFKAAAPSGWVNSGYLGAVPAQPEEGSSSGSTSFAILPSTAWLTAEATLDRRTLRITGSVAEVDLQLAEQQMTNDGWIDEPIGAPLGGKSVSMDVTRRTWVARQTGTTYDFVLKRTVPRYEYDEREERIGRFAATSGADGSFELAVPDLPAKGSYEIELSVTDVEGRSTRISTWVDGGAAGGTPSSRPYLEVPNSCSWYYLPAGTARLGEDVTLTIRERDGSISPQGRTLYLAGRLGLQETLVTMASTFSHTFADDDLPGYTVRAIRILPGGILVTNDFGVRLADGEKQIDVVLQPDRATYAPGADASVAITTLGPSGRPLAADVIVRVIDKKLYAVGAAQPLDTSGLMASVSAGFLASYASHRIPESLGDGCGGATSGGGGDEVRDEFKDLAAFELVRTDATGRGRATFKLPDDITTWEVGAAAFADGLEAGTGAIELPASLDFFVDAVIAPTYLAGEEPVIQLRAYGDGLQPGDLVRFSVKAPSLGMEGTTVQGRAFEAVSVALPQMSLGNHRITVAGRRTGSAEMRDTVVRTLRVVQTRLRTIRSSFDALVEGGSLPGGDGLTTYVVTDSGRGGLLAVLQSLATGATARLDASLAAAEARTILAEEYGMDPDSLPASAFNPESFYLGRLALFPYATPDLFLSARVALLGPNLPGAETRAGGLRGWLEEAEGNRERRIVALAGLAGLGDDVLGDLRDLGGDDLTVVEQLWLALGLAAAGDEDGARTVERAVLSEHGRRLGDWVRVEGETAADIHEATALTLLLAAQLRDPIALDLSRYLQANPSSDQIAPLEQLGFVRAALRWLPRAEARFAWSLDGDRHVEAIEAGGSFHLVLTATQRGSISIEPLEGEMVVASSWDGAADYESLPSDPLVSIERVVRPAGSLPAATLVQVRLRVTIDPNAPGGCYEVTDLVPSGLAPIVATWDYYRSDSEQEFIQPYSVEGQRVSWCVDPKARPRPLGYVARVVTPGTYRWEPAVIQSVQEPSIGAATPLGSYVVQ